MQLLVLNIIPTNNYELIIQYIVDGNTETKYIDLSEEIFKYQCWESLRDIDVFKKVFVDDFNDGPCWPNNIDMNPIRIYNQSIDIKEIIKKNNNFDITIKNIDTNIINKETK